jgi:hypothetical protein
LEQQNTTVAAVDWQSIELNGKHGNEGFILFTGSEINVDTSPENRGKSGK